MLLRLGFIVAILIIASFPRLLHAADRPPNVLFLFADDLGWGDLACYGHPYSRTPHLDKLASQGTRFEQFYVTGITCCPSRTGFMTSKFPATYAKYPAGSGFGDRTTITQLLKNNGYATGHIGKWHIGPDSTSGTYGIDEIATGDVESKKKVRDSLGRDTSIYDASINFIEKHQDQPFYLNVWGHITHFPVNPAPQFVDRFKELKLKEQDFGAAMQEKFGHVRLLKADPQQGMRNYLADVSSLDDDVGRILAKLDELKLSDNTIVIFSSDHGPAPVKLDNDKAKDEREGRAEFKANMLGSPGPFRGGKHTMLEGGVRSPFIIRWPNHVPAGKVDKDSVISGIDWLPTLCTITDTKYDPTQFDGEDTSKAWLGKSTHARTKPLFWRVANSGATIGIRDGNYKAFIPQRKNGGDLELYNLTTDITESHNLSKEQPTIMQAMKSKAEAWAKTLPTDYENFTDKD